MKKIGLSICLIGLASISFAQKGKVATTKPVAAVATTKLSSIDSVSYVIGQNMGYNLKSNGLTNLNYNLFLEGLKNSVAGGKSRFSEKEAMACMTGLSATLGAKKAVENKKKYAKIFADGAMFLDSNKRQAGVKVTESGLQYLVLTEGTGEKPKATDAVTVHYKGTTIDGKQFDSSYDRGAPATFPLNGVIKGWTEGLQLMPVGSKYRFFIPFNLAYGENGSGETIPPYSPLIFDVELIKIGQ
ncbi:MAG: FKBP-type peptidyl-prolyl cis-trans isomerase [Sphingobacteriaceae bacterium]|nr:FKBP-type peptidyl-prolyl cis-trans isomerase [Sphingobacteriaceae bacterium]